MAVFAATDYAITINGTDWSDWLTSIELPISVADLTTTAFGSTWETRIGGLKSATISLNFNQDFADNGVDETMWNAIGTVATFVVKPTSSAVSATNPSYSGSALVTAWNPIGASVGALAATSVQWPVTGAITRATS